MLFGGLREARSDRSSNIAAASVLFAADRKSTASGLGRPALTDAMKTIPAGGRPASTVTSKIRLHLYAPHPSTLYSRFSASWKTRRTILRSSDTTRACFHSRAPLAGTTRATSGACGPPEPRALWALHVRGVRASHKHIRMY